MNKTSCRVVKTFLDYVKNTGPEFLSPLLAGIPYDQNYLKIRATGYRGHCERLLEERLVNLFGDDMIMFRIGKRIFTNRSRGIVNTLFNLFMSLERLIRYTPFHKTVRTVWII